MFFFVNLRDCSLIVHWFGWYSDPWFLNSSAMRLPGASVVWRPRQAKNMVKRKGFWQRTPPIMVQLEGHRVVFDDHDDVLDQDALKMWRSKICIVPTKMIAWVEVVIVNNYVTLLCDHLELSLKKTGIQNARVFQRLRSGLDWGIGLKLFWYKGCWVFSSVNHLVR